MTLADDLKAARALIDTPEKWQGKLGWDGSLLSSLARSTRGSHERYLSAKRAITKTLPKAYRSLPTDFDAIIGFESAPQTAHSDIMALFDRAIATAEEAA